MKRITVELLKSINACPDQVETFNKLFPKGASISMRSLAKAQKAGLDVFFLERLLTAPAWAEFKKIIAGQAWAEYLKIRGQALVKALLESE